MRCTNAERRRQQQQQVEEGSKESRSRRWGASCDHRVAAARPFFERI